MGRAWGPGARVHQVRVALVGNPRLPGSPRWPLDDFGGLRTQSKVKHSSSDGLETLVGSLGLQLG